MPFPSSNLRYEATLRTRPISRSSFALEDGKNRRKWRPAPAKSGGRDLTLPLVRGTGSLMHKVPKVGRDRIKFNHLHVASRHYVPDACFHT